MTFCILYVKPPPLISYLPYLYPPHILPPILELELQLILNVKSMDRLRVDEIGQNHLHVDAISEQFSGIYILQKTFIFLLSHLKVKQHMGR